MTRQLSKTADAKFWRKKYRTNPDFKDAEKRRSRVALLDPEKAEKRRAAGRRWHHANPGRSRVTWSQKKAETQRNYRFKLKLMRETADVSLPLTLWGYAR